MSVQILIGDALTRLRELPADSVDCVVTSPPYWGLRDYGTASWEGGESDCRHEVVEATRTAWANAVKGPGNPGKNKTTWANTTKEVGGRCDKCGAIKVDHQLGLEPTYQEHVAAIVAVFEEVRRVLKPTGTLWMNYGDSYATSPNGRSAADVKELTDDDRTFRDKPFSTIQGTLKSKDLCGIPWRVAFALQDAGWYLRQDIIWAKPNPMPESIKDRCTKAHEYLFLMAKSARYYFDADAIAEPVAVSTVARLAQDVDSQAGSDRVPGKTNGPMKAVSRRMPKDEGRIEQGLRPAERFGGGAGWRENPDARPLTRNRRSVWTVNTEGYSEAHFATFPPALIEPCILAGCPVGGTVLDPFFGAGTTGLVADRLQRNCIGIELNPEYAEIARRRIANEAGLFADIAIGIDVPAGIETTQIDSTGGESPARRDRPTKLTNQVAA